MNLCDDIRYVCHELSINYKDIWEGMIKRENRIVQLISRPMTMYEFCFEFYNDDYFNNLKSNKI